MRGYLTFIFVAFILLTIGDLTRKKGFNKLTIKRQVDKDAIVEGEEFKITTIIENNKLLPISYLRIEEEIPIELPRVSDENTPSASNMRLYYTSKYSVLWFERIKKTYTNKGIKRGTYTIKNMNISIGDIFGFSSISTEQEDSLEILVYPRIINFKQFNFESTNIQGDNIVKRWIYKDPLYIRGIREYNVEDRMKDIHWKSSLKMSKLMVKDYDYTSDREVIFIVDIQCGEPYWASIVEENVENAIKIAASLSQEAIKGGIATGMWTNALIVGFNNNFDERVHPSLNSFQSIMELSARMHYAPRREFNNFLKERVQEFNNSSTYIVITGYLNSESENILAKLKRSGVLIKMIDVSKNGTVHTIPGIEKTNYKGEY
jgi:uncharacterized protein (DUF58 family)